MRIWGHKQKMAFMHNRAHRLQLFYIEQDGLCAICSKPLKGFTPKIVRIDPDERTVYANQHLVHLHCTDRAYSIDELTQAKFDRLDRWNAKTGPKGSFISADFEMIF